MMLKLKDNCHFTHYIIIIMGYLPVVNKLILVSIVYRKTSVKEKLSHFE